MTICKNETCNKTLKGRSDRVFCSPKCKAKYHYRIRKETGESYFKVEVDQILRKNRSILSKFNTNNGLTVNCELMDEAGFNPRFFTHYWTNLSGDTFYFCYDQGYTLIKNNLGDKYKLIQWQKEMERQVFGQRKTDEKMRF